MMQLIVLFMLLSVPVWSSTTLNIEAGSVENSYNQVSVPGDNGTRFNLASSFPDQSFYSRLSLKHRFKQNHGIRLLYAPLEIEGNKTYAQNINFSNKIFTADNEIKSTYKFNSYRITYFYQFINNGSWLVQAGATLKIRDAKIRLTQNGVKSSREDLGVVPLLYLWSRYKWENGLHLTMDFDGLVAPQGRALDAAIMAGYLFMDGLSFNLGYRVLDGGVDNDKVYNFSQFNYYFASLDVTF